MVMSRASGRSGFAAAPTLRSRREVAPRPHDPPFLFFDEPFGALDALTREQMRIDLEKLWLERRPTVLFITHSISEGVALSDRIIVMTPRPGRVDQVIEVDLQRPREKAVIAGRRFSDYCDAIIERFMQQGIIRY
jgi:NitT/TauT family transport system ATP-binding protein